MSDHWEIFPCQMGEHVAWISYDHGVRSDVKHLPFAYCARFAAVLKQPDQNGLPSGDEFSHLNSIEDQLVADISQQEGIQLGRVTTNGKRYFTFLTSLDEAAAQSIADRVAAQSDYEILLAYEADPDRRCYWNELFPTEDDWQLIQDMRVEESLRNEGDALTTPRPIEHWAYFETPADRERFLSWSEKDLMAPTCMKPQILIVAPIRQSSPIQVYPITVQ